MKRFIKTSMFFIAFLVLSSWNNISEDKDSEEATVPVNSSLGLSPQREENEDIKALREERLQDIKSLRSIMGLDIQGEKLINTLINLPEVADSSLNQNLHKSGIGELILKLDSFYSEDLSYGTEVKLYKYRNKILSMKLSQSVPFTARSEEVLTSIRKSFLSTLLGEDTTELHNVINRRIIALFLDDIKNNSSQDHCFIYGNYVVTLSLLRAEEQEDGLLVKLYIFQNQ